MSAVFVADINADGRRAVAVYEGVQYFTVGGNVRRQNGLAVAVAPVDGDAGKRLATGVGDGAQD